MYENKIGVLVPHVMLPPKGTDFSKWAVVACDQYTSQPEYWEAARAYIGNAPNFMVKSIAEQEGIKMPSFFGYMIKFSLIVCLPIYVIVQLLFI